jgi:hypothetical protein
MTGLSVTRFPRMICFPGVTESMRRSLFTLLAMLLAFAGGSVSAQDLFCEEVPDSFIECDKSESGLLGRRYVDIQYLQLDGSSGLAEMSSKVKGFSTTFNVPAAWNSKLPEFLGQDVFIASVGMNARGSDGGISVDADFRSFTTGLNSYLYLSDTVRPFLQTGISTQFVAADISAGPFSLSVGDMETRFALNPGLEVYITKKIAWRSILEVDTKGRFDESLYRSELIYWATDKIFVRGGLIGDVQNDTMGGILGAGFAW